MSGGIVAHHKNGDGKRHLRVLHPSMSSAGLLLQCQWPWGRTISTQPLDRVEMHEDGLLPKAPRYSAPGPSVDLQTVWSPPRVLSETGNALSDAVEANYGSGIHEVLAARIVAPPKKMSAFKVANKWGITDADEQRAFVAHAKEAVESFITWMTKRNPWNVNLAARAKIRTEMSVAYDVAKNKTRLTSNPTSDTHEYKGLAPGELPGTADVVIDEIGNGNGDGKASAPDIIVIDHKTGDGFNMPRENAQLKSLALANAVRVGAKTAAIAIFHTPVENVSTMYVDEIDYEEIKEFRAQLRSAWKNIGTGQMRPGAHCSFCPASTICPTQAGAIVQVETGLAMTPERVGEIAQKLAAFQKTGEKIEAEIKAWIKTYGVPGSDGAHAVPRPDGKWYRTKPTKQAAWQITTKQLREVLGVEAAEKIFEALRKAGHLKDREYDDWRIVNDT